MPKPITQTKKLKKVAQIDQPNVVTHDIQDYTTLRNWCIDLVVNRGNIKTQVAEKLFDANGLPRIKKALTHWSMGEMLDYEQLETLGDSTLNKCVIWYLYRRFPELRNHEQGNFIMTEAKKRIIQKGTFSKYCSEIGLNKFIRYRELFYEENGIKKRISEDDSLREDVFEAFFGALEDLIDNRIMFTVGYSTVYAILASFLDTQEISIDIESLVANRTKIKELYDIEAKQGRNNTLEWITEADQSTIPAKLTITLVLRFGSRDLPTGKRAPDEKRFRLVGAERKEDGQEEVAGQALEWLKTNLGMVWKKK